MLAATMKDWIWIWRFRPDGEMVAMGRARRKPKSPLWGRAIPVIFKSAAAFCRARSKVPAYRMGPGKSEAPECVERSVQCPAGRICHA